MKLDEALFAYGSLTSADRILTALKITSKRYLADVVNIPAILYILMDDLENMKSNTQRAIITGTFYSKEKALEIKQFFIMVYNDEKNLVDFLNKKISQHYWRKTKKASSDKHGEPQQVIDTIIKTGLSHFL